MHVRQLPSGKWRWIAQRNGQRRSGTQTTKTAAKNAGRDAEYELGGNPRNVTHSTVEDLLTAWQAEHEDDWSPTYREDVRHVCSHLPRAFLDRDIGTVEPAIVATLQRTLLKAGWSAHRIQRVRGCISGAYRMGIDYGWTARNPVRDARAPKVDRSDVTPPEHDVVRAILAAAPANLRLFVWLAAITGARRGELVGLQWVDLSGRNLAIRRRVVQVAGEAPVVLDNVKTGRKGNRRLELDEATVAMLASHHVAQTEVAEARLLPAPVFVFSHDAGVSPWRPDYPTQAFVKLRNTVPGAQSVRLHDLRHYVATTRLQDGDSPIDVAADIGHSTTRTTLTVYAHYMPGRGGASAARRAARLQEDT